MREVIARDGKHYRLHERNPQIVQVQEGPGLRWKTHSRWVTPDLARAQLAALGQHDPAWDEVNENPAG